MVKGKEMKYFENKGKWCSVPSCPRKAREKGMCHSHYVTKWTEVKMAND